MRAAFAVRVVAKLLMPRVNEFCDGRLLKRRRLVAIRQSIQPFGGNLGHPTNKLSIKFAAVKLRLDVALCNVACVVFVFRHNHKLKRDAYHVNVCRSCHGDRS